MIRRRAKELVFREVGWFPYYGERVYFPKDSFLFRLACRQGTYEHSNVRLLLRLVEPGSTFLDIGANIGLMALPVLRGQPACRVVSYEPSPATYPFLRRTALRSSHRDRWQVVEQALGARVGELDFHVAGAGMGAFDGFHETGRAGVATRVLRVPVTTVDEEWRSLGKPRVSVMKVDVEGAELEVLEGAAQCISTQAPHILVEWNLANATAAGKTPGDLLRAADAIGYRVYAAPQITRVVDEADLRTQMMFTEDFLLGPSART